MKSKHAQESESTSLFPEASIESARIIDVDFTYVGIHDPYDYNYVSDEQLANQRIIPTLGMDFPEEALHGLAGDIVKKLLPYTEAHPAALLAHVLLRFGNVIGRTAYVMAENTRQYTNEFAVIVGKSSKARKGTASDHIHAVFHGLDAVWEETRHTSGFGSGEALVSNVRDDQEIPVRIKGGETKIHVVEGFKDKRLFIREGEFAKVLFVCQREGNTLSPQLRDAFDGKTLRNNVKNGALTATDTHISAVCDVTCHELNASLKDS
jgi:hypothetical protein